MRIPTPHPAILGLALLACPGSGGAVMGQEGPVTLEYVAHASFLVHSPGGESVLIDPYASRVWLGYDFPAEVVPGTVLITHPHYDHDGGRYRELDVPWGPDVQIIDAPGTTRLGDLTVEGIEGKHADPYGKEFGQINTIFVVETGGLRIAHVGDNGPLTEDNVKALGRVDILMLPIDGVYHILSAETIDEILAAVAPRVVVPMHYRIPELETDPDSPSDLGPVDPWLEGRTGVRRLDGNRWQLSLAHLAGAPDVVVFQHSPRIPSVEPRTNQRSGTDAHAETGPRPERP